MIEGVLKTLTTILKDYWEWRGQITSLSLFELRKQSRGAVLGWAWFFVRPAIYVVCFWFALEIGLRAGKTVEGAPPYILWLTSGLFPWFFMQGMINRGSDVLHRYPYLVNKIKFPLSGISGIFSGAEILVHLMLLVVLFVIYFACGMTLDVYLLQVPLLVVLMFLFWNTFSIMFSQLAGVSKDMGNLIKTLSTPLFWLSGVIFDVKGLPNETLQTILNFNPVTFFVEAYRCAFYKKVWFWDDPGMIGGFAVVFLITLVAMLVVYKRFNEEVVDVL